MPVVKPTMQDPRSQYSRIILPQHQDHPGLVGPMHPAPDHGEESYVGSGRLMGRKALITGGDSGIGRAVAIAFAREGADVAINFLPTEQDDANQVAQLIEQAGRKAVLIPGDIQDETFCQSLVTQAHEALGGLDILVNNASTMKSFDSLAETPTAEFDTIMKTNVYSLFWITKAAMELLPPGAAVINTTSEQAYSPTPRIGVYAMTKAAIASFTKGMAPPMMKKGIRINGVAPGPFWTPMQATGVPALMLPVLGHSLPLGRMGQPAEIAPVYVFLASQEASYVTGEIYGVTGGEGIARTGLSPRFEQHTSTHWGVVRMSRYSQAQQQALHSFDGLRSALPSVLLVGLPALALSRCARPSV